MQARIRHQFVAELHLADGSAVSTRPLEVDWVPLLEWAHLAAVRQGLASLEALPRGAWIVPRWDSHGPPYLAGLAVTRSALAAGSVATRSESIPLHYLLPAVRQEVGRLVEARQVAEGAEYTWRVCAFESAHAAAATEVPEDSADAQTGAEAEAALPGLDLATLLAAAEHRGPHAQAGAAFDLPLVLHARVLREAAQLARAAGELETGGVLLGRVSRDLHGGDLVISVTAQIPAHATVADEASLRFTAATWQAVHAAIELRHAGEGIVGWWHSHPVGIWPCRDCPAERRAVCRRRAPFFSAADVRMHRTAFAGARNVALLLSFQDPPEPLANLFGWRQGLVVERDFHVVQEET